MGDQVCTRRQADIQQIERCKRQVAGLRSTFSDLAGFLELSSNEVRLKILYLLYREESLCVCDLSDILEMSVSAVSQHLRKMKDRRLIEMRREGQTIFYSIDSKNAPLLEPLFTLLEQPEREDKNTGT